MLNKYFHHSSDGLFVHPTDSLVAKLIWQILIDLSILYFDCLLKLVIVQETITICKNKIATLISTAKKRKQVFKNVVKTKRYVQDAY